MPRVTVVTPNYNHAQYLPKRIDSVLGMVQLRVTATPEVAIRWRVPWTPYLESSGDTMPNRLGEFREIRESSV